MEADKDYIFINYSRKDLTKVSPIVEEMRKRGYNVWYDANIQPGKDWPDYIAAHIKDCAVCVAFHSQASRDSQHCREEIHYALKHKKTVISVYLEDVTLKEGLDMQLSRFQAVKYAEPAELLEALRKSPDFERCGKNVPDAPKKRKGVNIKRVAKPLLIAVSLLLVIQALLGFYRKHPPIWLLDENGILDIISPPLLNVQMPNYSYYPGNDFYPPPWASKSSNIKCAIIRKGVTHIGASAFKNCYHMKFVFIPEGVCSIGAESFSGCTELTEINFPYSLNLLGEYAFSSCTALKQVQSSWGLEMIRGWAFANCTALEEITIPSTTYLIGPGAFSGCSNLKTVRIHSTLEKAQIIEDEDWDSFFRNILRDSFSIFDCPPLYISATAFEPGTKIIFEPPDADADVVEYIWGSD